MRRPIVAGNWKMHGTRAENAVLLDATGTVLAKGLVNSREHFESLIISHEMGVHSVQDYIAGLPTPAKVHA